jgi:SNF2 family DNA or RNA helicase
MITKASLEELPGPIEPIFKLTLSLHDGTKVPFELLEWLQGLSEGSESTPNNVFLLSSETFLENREVFKYFHKRFGEFVIETTRAVDETVAAFLRRDSELRSLLSDSERILPADEIRNQLARSDFSASRLSEQTSDQLRDLGRLALLPHGANFSVPGAGKTNTLLALHCLTRLKIEGLHLLVICPKNALDSWDKEVKVCLSAKDNVVRLEGGVGRVTQLLSQKPRISAISYQQLRTCTREISHFLRTNRVHLVLDESHRIKAGSRSIQGSSALQIAPYAARRDILSGTPMPQGLSDLEAQFEFLWPGKKLLGELSEGDEETLIRLANEKIRPLYVRTTKSELGLRKPHYRYHSIQMEEDQREVWELLRSSSARFFANLPSQETQEFRKVGKQIMRVLQFCSDPGLLLSALPATAHYGELATKLRRLTVQDSSKVKTLDALVTRILAKPEEKVVIWSMFVDQIESLVRRYSEFGALSLHGGIPTGPASSIEFREGRIAQFESDETTRMIIANPAACGEGISLHRAAHNAIYFDRSFNAAHFLQSIDRIHRRGLPQETETNIHILYLEDSIESAVRDRLNQKVKRMQKLLDDTDLSAMVFDPEDAERLGLDDSFDYSDLEAIREVMKV